MTTVREQIIETTCGLLEQQGYHATGLNQIIKESGCPKGSLYYYFPGGKEALTAEALQRVGSMMNERIHLHLATDATPADAISAFIRDVARAVEVSSYCAGGPITTVALETASSSDRLREDCHSIYETWRAAIADKLHSGGMEAARAEALSFTILAALEGGIILCRTHQSVRPLEAVAETVALFIACA
jgi:TetR/AcrR family transcriptional repressor of lmrAB and yxaGH operons